MKLLDDLKAEIKEARAGTAQATKLLADLNTQGLPAALKQVISQVNAQVLAQGATLARIELKAEGILDHADAAAEDMEAITESLRDAPAWLKDLYLNGRRTIWHVSNLVQEIAGRWKAGGLWALLGVEVLHFDIDVTAKEKQR